MTKVVASTAQVPYKTIVQAADKQIIVDEPTALGGGNSGFQPTELLAAALASCTSITLRMYANRKEWNIEQIQVEVSLDRTNPTESVFERKIEILGELDEQQYKRILAIANACPVHKILEGNIRVDTSIRTA